MTTSNAIRTMLTAANKKQCDLVGVISPARAGVSNKMVRDYWTTAELVKIAALTGYRLVLQSDQDGTVLEIK